jgi:acyl-CoA thioesterase
VLQSASIDYLEPVYEDDVLVATATARVRKKRTGIYDIEIRNQSDKLVALVTDKSFTLKREQSA